jgi:hypothetical protein
MSDTYDIINMYFLKNNFLHYSTIPSNRNRAIKIYGLVEFLQQNLN